MKEIMESVDVAPAARVSAAAYLLDRGWGKATQVIDATIHDKRDAADWTRAELVSFIHDAQKGSSGTAAEDGREGQPDSVH